FLFGARPRPTSEGIETKRMAHGDELLMHEPGPAPPPRGLKLSKKALSRACQMDQPDPAPPPRGLKPAGRDLIHGLLHVLGARPRPTSEGIETQIVERQCLTPVAGTRPRPTSERIENR